MKKLITIFLLLIIFLLGCSQGTQYNPTPSQPNGQQDPNVGGGCGVEPQNSDTPDVNYAGISEGF